MPRLIPHTLACCLFLFTGYCGVNAAPGEKFPELAKQETEAIDNAIPSVARAKPVKSRKLLVFYRTEGFVHKSIPNGNYALAKMGAQTGAYQITLSDDMAMFEPATLSTFDAVLFNNTSQLKFENPAYRKALLDFVNSGKGLIGIHAASDNFPTWPEGQALIGGVFHEHPWTAGDTVAVKNDDPEHVLNTAFQKRGFWVTEEIYQIDGPYSREKQRVLLSLDMSRPENARPANKIFRADNDFAISWLKTEGKGRVFYTSLGHNKNIYETPQILQHFLDGIQYALGDLPADSIPSAKLKNQPTPVPAPNDKTTIQAQKQAVSDSVPLPALDTLALYEDGNPLAPLHAYEAYLRTASLKQRASAEQELLLLMQAPKTSAAAQRVFLGWLGWIGTESSVPVVTRATTQPELAHAATRALGNLPGNQAVDALISIASGPGLETVRIEALNALNQRRASAAISALAKLGQDQDDLIAEAALSALANIGTKEAIEALLALPRPTARERQQIRAILIAVTNQVQRFDGTYGVAPAISAADICQKLLSNTTDSVAQVEIAQTLLHILPDPSVIKNSKLLDLLVDKSSSPRLQTTIACGLADASSLETITLLTAHYPQLSTKTQLAVLAHLASTPNPVAMPLVESAIKSEQKELQIAALAAAGVCGNSDAVKLLFPFVISGDSEIASAAATACAQLPDADGKTNALFGNLLRETATSAKDANATASLLRICAARQYRPAFETAACLVSDNSDVLRTAAFETVALLVQPGDLPQIISLANNIKRPADRREWTKALYNSSAMYSDSKAAVALLQKELPNAKPADRPILIGALTMISDPSANAVLRSMLGSQDAATRKETIRALSSARTATAFDLLTETITKATDTSERALAQRGALDTVDYLAVTNPKKVDYYRILWATADTQETKDAIIAALKNLRVSAATKFLEEIAPSKN